MTRLDRRRVLIAGLTAVVVAAVGLWAVTSRADGASHPRTADRAAQEPAMTATPTGPLAFTLAARPERPAPGTPVEFRMTLRNQGDVAVDLLFMSGQSYDITIATADGTEVWRWAVGRMFTQSIREVTLAPGETREYTATWEGRDNDGNVPPPGEYRATAVLTADPRLQSSVVPIVLTAP
jgi:hypothetical protein